LFGLFKKDPTEKLKKEYQKKLEEAMNAQRRGDIQKYAELTAEAEELVEKIKELN
jgi:septal ring factor EnvC (AmiA/AmiB activator)